MKRLTKEQKHIKALELEVGELKRQNNNLEYQKRDAEKQRDACLKEKREVVEQSAILRRNFEHLAAEARHAADALDNIKENTDKFSSFKMIGEAMGILDAANRICDSYDRKGARSMASANEFHNFWRG